MAESQLMLHRGARVVEPDELNSIKAPQPVGRWYPSAHGTVLAKVKETLRDAGYLIKREQLGVSADNARFFGTLDLSMALVAGVSLAVGVRNSFDKTFPIGFCAGSRVFCCDNLAFRAELLVSKKHTKNGEIRFGTAIAEAVTQLDHFRKDEAQRVLIMQETEVDEDRADSLILRSFEKGIVPMQALAKIVREWREPTFEDFRARTLWSLFNAYTTVLGAKATVNPHAYCTQTMRLSGHLIEEAKEALAVAA